MLLLARICSDDMIAGLLNRNDIRTGHGNRWTRERVTSLRSHHDVPVYRPETAEADGWMNLTRAAAVLGASALRPCALPQPSLSFLSMLAMLDVEKFTQDFSPRCVQLFGELS
jgi:hypothetical protein